MYWVRYTGLRRRKNETTGPGRTGVDNLAADRGRETDQEEDGMSVLQQKIKTLRRINRKMRAELKRKEIEVFYLRAQLKLVEKEKGK